MTNISAMKSAARGHQVGGTHYADMVMDPNEFSMLNGLDACSHSIIKYVARHRAKDGKRDLGKAASYVAIRRALCEDHHRVIFWTLPVESFCLANKLGELETEILLALESWIITGVAGYGVAVQRGIEALIEHTYSEQE